MTVPIPVFHKTEGRRFREGGALPFSRPEQIP